MGIREFHSAMVSVYLVKYRTHVMRKRPARNFDYIPYDSSNLMQPVIATPRKRRRPKISPSRTRRDPQSSLRTPTVILAGGEERFGFVAFIAGVRPIQQRGQIGVPTAGGLNPWIRGVEVVH